MRKPVVFLGPTLPQDAAAKLLDATYLPPAARGDVYRAALDDPPAIGIIDGYFAQTPAVWHKEILWALSKGIWVFGASSMGALRAAELASFGMIGVGQVFEWFHRGVLEDDDEVAILHASAEDGYRPLSDALVNIRATLEGARRARVVTRETETILVALAKGLPFGERRYELLLAEARRRFPARERELERLTAWCAGGRIDIKRRDATGLLEVMGEWLASAPKPDPAPFELAWTDAWEALTAEVQASRRTTTDAPAAGAAIWEEVVMHGLGEVVFDQALSLVLASEDAGRRGQTVSGAALNEVALAFRRERGLETPEQFAAWLTAQGIALDADLDAFFQREMARRYAHSRTLEALHGVVPDVLRRLGLYGEFASRSRDKHSRLGGPRGGPAAAAVPEATLWSWYFAEVARRAPVADRDAYARANGFEGATAMRSAIVREYLFRVEDQGRFAEGAPKETAASLGE